MGSIHREWVAERDIGRRSADFLVRHQNNHYKKIFYLGQIITSEMDINRLFDIIMSQINDIMSSERCTVFVYDHKTDELWSRVATGVEKSKIRIPANSGLAGYVFHNRLPVISNMPYDDPRFNPEIDLITGFSTSKVICVPLINREKQCIGALEALNKIGSDFDEEDVTLITAASHYVTIALENAKLFEDLKQLDRAKERVINHLSHELTTPLAIISGSFENIAKKVERSNWQNLKKPLQRGLRNTNRLFDIKNKMDDILNNRNIETKLSIVNILEYSLKLLEDVKEERDDVNKSILNRAIHRLEVEIPWKEPRFKEIDLFKFLNNLCDEAIASMGAREPNLLRSFPRGQKIFFDGAILRNVCEGMLKNAIENTPDEGFIALRVLQDGETAIITFEDHGVGISPENQKHIFNGFFHTQETKFYSSKAPYEFNAGGSGLDLLRMKALSERYGFSIDFSSNRCRYIHRDADFCCGRIFECPHIHHETSCFHSGGSTFSIRLDGKVTRSL